MEDITGTAGDDIIIGRSDINFIDGRAGKDTLDYSNIGVGLFLSATGSSIGTSTGRSFPPGPTGTIIYTYISNIETIIGDPTKSNTISYFGSSDDSRGNFEINLSTGRLGVDNITVPTVKNFDNVDLSNGAGRVVGNARDNQIRVSSTSTITASKGNDTLGGGTLDYSNQ